jgi:hypothetical protein
MTVGDCALDADGFVFVKGGELFVTHACGLFVHTSGNLSVDCVLLDPNLDADGKRESEDRALVSLVLFR